MAKTEDKIRGRVGNAVFYPVGEDNRIRAVSYTHLNGHGRTSGGGDPVSRQSNLIVETTRPYTDDELRAMLVEEAKKQGKEYGYFFRTVTSGFTYTGEGGSCLLYTSIFIINNMYYSPAFRVQLLGYGARERH